jgi:Ca-activated chloride channel family protein
MNYNSAKLKNTPGLCVPRPVQCPPYFPPAHGGSAIVNNEAFDAMFFKNYGVNPFVFTEDDHFSTFATDVDDASYIMTRSYLERGELPPNEAVRVEEFVNHFNYGYDPPYNETFTVYMEGSPSRFGKNCSLLRVGIKGKEIPPELRKPANLVFVIDVSGSMAREDRLELVKKALRELVGELREDDRVGIVIYGSHAREVLQPTSIKNRHSILDAIEQLCTGGATNAEHGIRLGYQMADRCFEKGKINRIILCSDGVANVGRTGADDILKEIKQYADKGITLSTIGFGMGNYNDILMEKLGNKGNGHYAYVDDIAEARRIFVDNLTGNLQVIARDVKIQVDFDPEMVLSYRLLGFENRDVADNKFRDDTVDGGEIGAGHSVTALYEIKFHKDPKSVNLGTIFIRYKDPSSFEVTEISRKIDKKVIENRFEDCSVQFKMAASAAQFAEIMRDSYWARGESLQDVLDVTGVIHKENKSPELIELMHLIAKANQLKVDLAEK